MFYEILEKCFMGFLSNGFDSKPYPNFGLWGGRCLKAAMFSKLTKEGRKKFETLGGFHSPF